MAKVVREKFQVGDLVEWTSKAGGVNKTKTGKVAFVLGHETYAHAHFEEVAHKHSATRDNFGRGHRRNHESYFVLVTHDTGNPKRPRKPDLYWPRVSALKKAEPVTV